MLRTPQNSRAMPSIRLVISVGTAGLLGLSGYCYLKGSPIFFERVIMPAVSCMDPERAHHAAVWLASMGIVPRDNSKDPTGLQVTVWGRHFSNPIGLAAGFDKHAEAYPGLLKMGFGFVEVGSVTPKPQPGNPRPRVFRLSEDKAVINRYGFNSHGHEVVRERLALWSKLKVNDKHLGVNLGKNKDSSDTAADYIEGIRTLGEHADYIVINVSSPNTPGLRDMQGRQQLAELLDKVTLERSSLPHKPPLLVKIAPDLSHKDKKDIASVVMREKGGADGIIVCNTTIERPETLRSAHRIEAGGLSGQPLKDFSTTAISDMYKLTDGKLPIVGVGGVASGRDAYEKILAGASLVQVYTVLAYEGPPAVRRIKTELADLLSSNGYSELKDAVGGNHKKQRTSVTML